VKVLVDGQIFALQRYGGISRYFVELLKRPASFPGCDLSALAPVHVNRILPQAGGAARGLRVPAVPRTWRQRLWLSRFLTRLSRPSADVLHKTYYYDPDWSPRGARVVTTVYDMIHEKFPRETLDDPSLPRFKAATARAADRVICISESTRRDLLALVDLPPEKVRVVPLAADLPAAPPRTDVPRPYILFVGQRKGYKNFDVLLRAYGASPRLRKDFALLCFGGERFIPGEAERVRRAAGADGMVLFQGGGDDVLAASYAGASAFVFPSKYEGFGLPLLEAMGAGCPCVAGDGGSLPEVGSDAALYFPPEDEGALRERLEGLLWSESARRFLTEKGRARAAGFSWDETARRTCDVYKELA
jgi:glycosyltransferase involved in cell wall biosynthesis